MRYGLSTREGNSPGILRAEFPSFALGFSVVSGLNRAVVTHAGGFSCLPAAHER